MKAMIARPMTTVSTVCRSMARFLPARSFDDRRCDQVRLKSWRKTSSGPPPTDGDPGGDHPACRVEFTRRWRGQEESTGGGQQGEGRYCSVRSATPISVVHLPVSSSRWETIRPASSAPRSHAPYDELGFDSYPLNERRDPPPQEWATVPAARTARWPSFLCLSRREHP